MRPCCTCPGQARLHTGAWNAGVAAGFALTGLAVGRTGPAAPMRAGAAALMVAALAVLMRRDTFDSARLPRH
jgi:predicted MFS family arabinose efflux permease